MSAQSLRRRTRVAAVIALVLAAFIVAASSLWRTLSGNQRFSFYGRIVDEQGRGIPGVKVEAQLCYSGGITLPVMFGRPEHVKALWTTTKDDGTYEFVAQTGYAFSIRSVTKPGFKLVDAVPPPYPPSTWTSDDPLAWQKLPNQPDKRAVAAYKLIGTAN